MNYKLATCHQCCGSGSGRLLNFLLRSGSRSGRLGPDLDLDLVSDPDLDLNKYPYLKIFSV
jgi:hypothetical protein